MLRNVGEPSAPGLTFTIRRADATQALKEIEVNRGSEGADDDVQVLVSESTATFRAVGTQTECPVKSIGPGTAQLPISIFAKAIDMRSTKEIELRIAPGVIFCGKALVRHSAIKVGTTPDLRISVPINPSPFDLIVIDRVLGSKAVANQGLTARVHKAKEGLSGALSKAAIELADYGIGAPELELLIETAMCEAEPKVRRALYA